MYITLYIPKNVTVYFNKSTRNFIYDVKNTHNIHHRDMIHHHFKMTLKGLDCTDCDIEEDKDDNQSNL